MSWSGYFGEYFDQNAIVELCMEYSTLYEAKKRCNPTIREYLEAAQLFHWAKKEHYTVWFKGNLVRDGRTERVLKRLVDKGRLRSVGYGRCLVYCAKRLN